MRPTVEVEYEAVKTMARELAAISGKDYAYVLKSEGASMIKIAALGSKLAKVTQIKEQVRTRVSRNYADDRGRIFQSGTRVWFRSDQNNKFYMVFDRGPTRGWHLPTLKWADYLYTAGRREDYIKLRIAELAKRSGIERLSWLQMGDAMGVQLSAVAPQGSLQEEKARGAAANGRQFKNGSALEQDSGPQYTIIVTNDSPVAVKRGGQDRLDRAINQRARGFEIAMQKGVLEDLDRRAKRWPGIFVQAA